MTDGRDEATGRFTKGNRFWEARSSAGPKPKFKKPEDLWAACCEYFEWSTDNPLYEAKAFAYQGDVTVKELPKMRAMTIGGLCMFLDIDVTTWRGWREPDSDTHRPDLSTVITRAEEVIRRQKFEGAAAELLNPNIIARDIGLSDKQTHEHSGPGGEPMQFEDVTADAASFASRMSRLAAAKAASGGDGEAEPGSEGGA